MKKRSILLFLTLLTTTVFAQSRSKSALVISAGPSFPVGQFENKNINDRNAGLAKTGFFTIVGHTYKFNNSLGLVGTITGAIHGIDASSYQVPSGVGASSSIRTTNWKTGTLLVGLSQSLPLENTGKLTIEFEEQIGIQFAKSPEMDIRVSVPGIGSMNGKQEASNGSGFAYALRAGLKYELSSGFGLKLFGDYSAAKTEFNRISIVTNESTTYESSEQRIQTLSLGLGLCFSF